MGEAPLVRVVEDVYQAEEPVRIVGARLSTNMTVLRLPDASLLVCSPVPLTEARRAAVAALGPVAHLYAPNAFHHLWLAAWIEAYPDAKVHAPSSLRTKRPDLRIDRTHGEPESSFAGVVEEVPIEGFRLDESALVFAPARAVVVTDLVHNIGRPEGTWTRLYTRATGFYDRVALSRVLRWTAFSDRAAARRAVDRLLACDGDRLLVGHGTALREGGRDVLAAAYRWLAG